MSWSSHYSQGLSQLNDKNTIETKIIHIQVLPEIGFRIIDSTISSNTLYFCQQIINAFNVTLSKYSTLLYKILHNLGDTINVYVIMSAIFHIIHVVHQENIIDTKIDYQSIF